MGEGTVCLVRGWEGGGGGCQAAWGWNSHLLYAPVIFGLLSYRGSFVCHTVFKHPPLQIMNDTAKNTNVLEACSADNRLATLQVRCVCVSESVMQATASPRCRLAFDMHGSWLRCAGH